MRESQTALSMTASILDYDYAMGGLLAIADAESASEITDRYPEVVLRADQGLFAAFVARWGRRALPVPSPFQALPTNVATTKVVVAEILSSAYKPGISDDDNDYVIHAMPDRPKYLKLIRPHRGDQP